MSDQEKRYTSDSIVVRYNPKRCIHFAACVRGLPAVFDKDARPWIKPGNADADTLAAVIARCPTGALHFERLDGGAAEQPEPNTSIEVAPDGPLYLRGDVTVQRADGTPILVDTRVALCRCGMSGNKPFCDGSHNNGFSEEGRLAAQDQASGAGLGGPITVIVRDHGPYRVKGAFTISGADGEQREYAQATLCRCGTSKHKPFCDGSHQNVNQEIFE